VLTKRKTVFIIKTELNKSIEINKEEVVMLTKDMKVKLFTHSDLDGIGCAILGRLAFEDIDVEICEYNNINQKVTDFINAEEYKNYDHIFITDISVNEEVQKLINLNTEFANKLNLIDHHQTAEFLNVNPWAYVRTKTGNKKDSGTSLFFEHLLIHSDGFFRDKAYRDALTIFVEKVRRYDTWEWKEIYNDQEALELNNLLYLLGKEKFADKFVNKFLTLDLFTVKEGSWVEMFDNADRAVLDVDRAKANEYFDKKEKQMIRIKFLGNEVGVVFAEQYISELGNVLSERNPDLKYIAIIDMGGKKVSLRTVHDDINLGKDVAKLFGGGGHPKASGFQFSEDIVNHAVKSIFNIGGFLMKIKKLIIDNIL
jgi:uncharacterized protein